MIHISEISNQAIREIRKITTSDLLTLYLPYILIYLHITLLNPTNI